MRLAVAGVTRTSQSGSQMVTMSQKVPVWKSMVTTFRRALSGTKTRDLTSIVGDGKKQPSSLIGERLQDLQKGLSLSGFNVDCKSIKPSKLLPWPPLMRCTIFLPLLLPPRLPLTLERPTTLGTSSSLGPPHQLEASGSV
jgi:hypothetical protein